VAGCRRPCLWQRRIREAEQHDIEQEKIDAELHRIQRHLVTAQSSITSIDGGVPVMRAPRSGTQQTTDGELEALWLGGRVQAEHELAKLARALHTPAPAPTLPLDLQMAVETPQATRPAVLDEISRIDRFLQQPTECR
jgi:hypothetical protein